MLETSITPVRRKEKSWGLYSGLLHHLDLAGLCTLQRDGPKRKEVRPILNACMKHIIGKGETA